MNTWIRFTDSKLYPSNPTAPEGMRRMIVKRADEEYPFLHDTMITSYKGRLLMAWYNCSEAEIVGKTVIRGRWSSDGGETWTDPEIIAQGAPGDERHYVPVTFYESGGDLYAYTTIMTAHDRPAGYACMGYDGHKWQFVYAKSELVLFNTLPVRMEDGSFIAGGRMAARSGDLPLIPVVATTPDERPADWRISPLPGPWDKGEYPLRYPETALWVENDKQTAIVRNDENAPYVYHSQDYGRHWMGPYEAQLPIAPSKMCAGTLKNGKKYLIYNERTVEEDRSRLTIALCGPAESAFTQVYRLTDGRALDAGPYWHYPCALEENGILYITCTSSCNTNARHAALFRIPVESL